MELQEFAKALIAEEVEKDASAVKTLTELGGKSTFLKNLLKGGLAGKTARGAVGTDVAALAKVLRGKAGAGAEYAKGKAGGALEALKGTAAKGAKADVAAAKAMGATAAQLKPYQEALAKAVRKRRMARAGAGAAAAGLGYGAYRAAK